MSIRRLSAHCLAVITVLATVVAGTPAAAAADAGCDGPWLSAMQVAGDDAGALSLECGEENRVEEEVDPKPFAWIDPAPPICLIALRSVCSVPTTSRGLPLGVGETLSIRGPPIA
jgi:hypothetical protein